ncbi:MAG: hypothetical protein KDD55_11060 [Bdellovibrionales bacterium]|nr:hypothetical protein [Bdellovibrionales bacterium]
MKHERQKTPEYFASQPTAITLFFRKFLPWQIIRFVLINLKMFGLIWVSHRECRKKSH